ncbi:MAG TPA: DmsE family decaheme c-type cytochrome [Clostridia bacterium]|nr:DmsE family decaheme c-type cytochrome [Clostridia bacterium]
MKDPRTLQRYSVWVFAALLLLLGAVQLMAAKRDKNNATQTKDQPKSALAGAAAGQFVGADTCKGCHEDQFRTIDATPHYRTTLKGRGEDAHGCESCHGPGAAHVEAGGDKSKIFTFTEASPQEVTDRCLTCHESNLEQMTFQRSVHNKNGVTCTSCHSPHHARERQYLMVQKQPELCYSCHGEQKSEFIKPFRHRVNEGLVNCSDCHNVHGGSVSKQLRTQADQSQACFKCHSDKKGPFVFEHEPVKTEGCTVCHTPHGSVNPRLLTRSRMNSLCLECHTGIPPGPHPQNTRSQACTLCHSAIHGSNTSDVFFK